MPLVPLTALYWSTRGEVACDDHAPKIDDPRWTVDGWERLPDSYGYVAATHYQCQHCAEDRRAVVHEDHDDPSGHY